MKIPSLTLPKYTTTLPIANIKVTYRPFMVREEKMLLLAIQEEDASNTISTIYDISTACTFGAVNVHELNQIDLEYLFLQIRNKSMGEGVDAESTCIECGFKNSLSLDFAKAKPVGEFLKDTRIQLSDTAWVKLRYPTMELALSVKDSNDFDQAITMVSGCVESIIIGEEVYSAKNNSIKDISDFLEDLSQEAFEKLNNFFDSMPKLVFEETYSCSKCGKQNRIYLEGLESFFG